jgi:hypothetical protein
VSHRVSLPIEPVGADWRDTLTIKARLAGGCCLRAPAQEVCRYANVCEHGPSFRTDAGHVAVLASQRVDAQALAADAGAAAGALEPTATTNSPTGSTSSLPRLKWDEPHHNSTSRAA